MATRILHSTENKPGNQRLVNPLRLSGLIAGTYLAFGVLYIQISSRIAASFVFSTQQFEHVETYKGTIFIFITASLLFSMLLVLFRRLNLNQDKIEQQRNAIAASGKHAMAGIFASSVAHDLNNILLISMYALDKLSENKEVESSASQHIDRLKKAHNQILNNVKRLEAVGGKHSPTGIRKTDIVATVINAIELAATHIKVKHCSIEHDLPQQCITMIDEGLIQGALLNLVINAAEAAGKAGRICVKLFDEENVRLEVHDNGPGIPVKSRDIVTQPFYTTKDDGTGLGLFSLKYCAEIHGGAFGIDTSDYGGALIYLVFPKDQEALSKSKATFLHPAQFAVD